ncbi:chorismate mutase [Candidatus Latescibacterota bacterium]
MDDIAGWRKRIDEIDEKILKLLNERAECAVEIGKIKSSKGLEITDQNREESILKRLIAINKGPLSDEAVQKLFRCLIIESKNLE